MSSSYNETSIPHMLGRRADNRKLKRRSSKRVRRSSEENIKALKIIRKGLHL
jgi:hypothetical protein